MAHDYNTRGKKDFLYIYDYKFTLHSRKNKRQKEKHRQTKLHDRQMPMYRKVPANIK